jgi:hypothetical protein
MTISPNKTSLTFYVPLSLKLRIDAAAQADERSTSQYLVRLLDKIVPNGTPAQMDIETAIETADALATKYSGDLRDDLVVNTVSNNTSLTTLGDLKRARAKKHPVTEYGKVLKAAAKKHKKPARAK